jgi:serine/threonine-protein kinase
MTEVPDVVGLSYDEATDVLREANLDWERRERFSNRPPEQVVRQTPPAGEQVEEGTTVELVVSKGKEMVEVPDVLQQSEASARAELEAAGFEVTVLNAPSNDTDEGLVFDQAPDPGQRVPKGSSVQITVSTGPETTAVPNVVGEQRQQAENDLEEAGFEVEVVEEPTDDDAQNNIVVDQDPEGGSQAQPGSTVTITVAKS